MEQVPTLVENSGLSKPGVQTPALLLISCGTTDELLKCLSHLIYVMGENTNRIKKVYSCKALGTESNTSLEEIMTPGCGG